MEVVDPLDLAIDGHVLLIGKSTCEGRVEDVINYVEMKEEDDCGYSYVTKQSNKRTQIRNTQVNVPTREIDFISGSGHVVNRPDVF